MPMGFRFTSATTEDVSTVTTSCAEAVAHTLRPNTSATTMDGRFFTEHLGCNRAVTPRGWALTGGAQLFRCFSSG